MKSIAKNKSLDMVFSMFMIHIVLLMLVALSQNDVSFLNTTTRVCIIFASKSTLDCDRSTQANHKPVHFLGNCDSFP